MGIETGFFLWAVILLAALVWGVMAYTRRNRANEPVTEAATRAQYADTDRYADKEPELRSKVEH